MFRNCLCKMSWKNLLEKLAITSFPLHQDRRVISCTHFLGRELPAKQSLITMLSGGQRHLRGFLVGWLWGNYSAVYTRHCESLQIKPHSQSRTTMVHYSPHRQSRTTMVHYRYNLWYNDELSTITTLKISHTLWKLCNFFIWIICFILFSNLVIKIPIKNMASLAVGGN